MVWNGNFGMEYRRCQNGMEDNLPYQFHTRFCALYLQKNIIRISDSEKYFCHESSQLQYLRVLFVDKSWHLGRVYCANRVRITSCKNNAICSIDVAKSTGLTCFIFILRLTICQVVFFFLPSSRKFVFAISSPFQLNFIYIFSFLAYFNSFCC